MKEVFSNHIGGSSELLVIADIKPGFVPIRTPMCTPRGFVVTLG